MGINPMREVAKGIYVDSWIRKATTFGFAIAAMLVANAGQVQAGLMTSSGALSSPLLVDFSEFSGAFNFTAGPVQIGNPIGEDIVYSSSYSQSVIGDGNYNLVSNGRWNAGRSGFVGINSPSDTIRFDFNDGLVSGVGGFVNYAPDYATPFTITALAADNSVLESYVIEAEAPISTPGSTDEGAFRGILRSTDDIAAFTITGGYGVLDNLTFGRSQVAAVPEPTSLAIFGIGALGLVFRRPRRS